MSVEHYGCSTCGLDLIGTLEEFLCLDCGGTYCEQHTEHGHD